MPPRRVLVLDSCTERHFSAPTVEEKILSEFEVDLLHVSSHKELNSTILEKVDALILWACIPAVVIGEDILSELKRCKVIVKAAVGYDNIDIRSAMRHSIPVYNTPDYGTEEVADHSVAMMLALVRRLKSTDHHVQNGGWDWKSIGRTPRVRGMKLGIIGFGRIGQAVAKRASSFGLEITFYDPHVPSGAEKSHGLHRSESLNELLQSSDIISINCSLTDSSLHLLGKQEFASMKRGVIIVNTARGSVIDTDALLSSLDSGVVAMAGLDVLECEPSIPSALRGRENVILTPHSAFYSDASFMEMREKSASMVRSSFEGRQLRNLVTL